MKALCSPPDAITPPPVFVFSRKGTEVTAFSDATDAALAAERADSDARISALEAANADLAQQVAALTKQLNPPALTEDFADLSNWAVYNGAGAYSQQGVRLAENSSVEGGVLTVSAGPVSARTSIGGKMLAVGDYAAGGVQHRTPRGPGTRYTMDIRMSASVGTRAVALLWPYQASWPEGGELDFEEDGADLADRQSTAITNHWANATGGNAQRVVKFGPHDFTEWTAVEVLWLPGLFVVKFDGAEAVRYTDNVPANQMKLSVQTAIAKGGQSPTFGGAPRTPGNIQVRNLRIYDADSE